MKKIFPILLILMLIVGMSNSLLAQQQEADNDSNLQTQQYGTGEIPVDTSSIIYPESNKINPLAGDSIPESYSLVDNGYVTSVKQQGSYGTCWAHSIIGSVESSLLVKGLKAYDLSELQLAYFMYNSINIADPLNLVKKDGLYFTDGFTLNYGGNTFVGSFIIPGGLGLVEESKLPYSQAYSIENQGFVPDSSLAYSSNSILVDNIRYYYVDNSNQHSNDSLKLALMENGAMCISYYAISSDNNDYYNKTTASVYNPNYMNTNHAVTLVGWDDNYSKDNFNPKNRPTEDGAWLVKNSWSKYWGDEGYFWLSYQDKTLSDTAIQFSGRIIEDEERIYQYNCTYLDRITSNKTIKIANTYTAQRKEQLNKIGFNILSSDAMVTINVYKTSDSVSKEKTLVSTTYSYVKDPGYYSVDLDNVVSLETNDKFTIELEFTGVYSHVSLPVSNEGLTTYGWFGSYNQRSEDKDASLIYNTNSKSWERSSYDYVIKGYTTPIKGLSFNQDTYQAYIGDTFVPQYYLENVNDQLEWESSDQQIATIDENGYITCLKAGECNITATIKDTGLSFSFKLKVVQPIESIEVSVSELSVEIGSAKLSNLLQVELLPKDNQDNRKLQYEYDSDYLHIEDDTVHFIKQGQTTLTLKISDSVKTTINVIINTPETLNAPVLNRVTINNSNVFNIIHDNKYYITDNLYYQYQISTKSDFSNSIIVTQSNLTQPDSNNFYIRMRVVLEKENGILYSNWSNSYKYIAYLNTPVLSGEIINGNQVRLNWDSIEDATSYSLIVQSTTAKGDYVYLESGNVTETIYTLPSFNDNYEFSICANYENDRDGYFSSLFSNVLTFRVDFKTPIIQSVSMSSGASLKVTINPDDTATYYEIYRSTTYNGKYVKIATTETNEYLDTTISPNKNYYYKVIKVNVNPQSSIVKRSSYSSYKVGKTTFSKPTIKSINKLEMNTLEINWNSINGANGYVVQRSTSTKFTSNLISFTTDSNYFIDDTVSYNKTYYYRVKAIDVQDTKTTSTSYSSYKAAKYTLTTPTLTLSKTDLNQLTVKWNSILAANSYIVQISTNSKFSKPLSYTTENNYFVFDNLSYNKVYYIRVKAVNDETGSTYYSSYKTISGKYVLNTPLVKITYEDLNQIRIIWDAVPQADYYIITKAKNSKFTGSSSIIVNAPLTSYLDNDVKYNTTYYYKVTAINNTSDLDNEVILKSYSSISRSGKYILATPSVTTTISNINEITLSWNEINEADSYIIRRADNSSFKNSITIELDAKEGINSYVDQNCKYGKTYYYRIQAVNKETGVNLYSSVKTVSKLYKLATPNLTIISNTGKMIVNWPEIQLADGYEVYRATSKSGKYYLTTLNDKIDTKAVKGKTYYYKVRAYVIIDGVKYYSNYSSIKYAKAK